MTTLYKHMITLAIDDVLPCTPQCTEPAMRSLSIFVVYVNAERRSTRSTAFVSRFRPLSCQELFLVDAQCKYKPIMKSCYDWATAQVNARYQVHSMNK